MRVRSLHPWNVSPREAMAIQLKLRARLRLDGGGPFATVAGIDASYDETSHLRFAGVVVMSGNGRQVLETAISVVTARFPYIPGLLSFRETPAVSEAWTKLKTLPDCLICDGHGLAHPRRFGLACHLGVLLDLPTIGCAKSRLVGSHNPVGVEVGDWAKVEDRGERVGLALRSKSGARPLYISAGHKIDLDGARRWGM